MGAVQLVAPPDPSCVAPLFLLPAGLPTPGPAGAALPASGHVRRSCDGGCQPPGPALVYSTWSPLTGPHMPLSSAATFLNLLPPTPPHPSPPPNLAPPIHPAPRARAVRTSTWRTRSGARRCTGPRGWTTHRWRRCSSRRAPRSRRRTARATRRSCTRVRGVCVVMGWGTLFVWAVVRGLAAQEPGAVGQTPGSHSSTAPRCCGSDGLG